MCALYYMKVIPQKKKKKSLCVPFWLPEGCGQWGSDTPCSHPSPAIPYLHQQARTMGSLLSSSPCCSHGAATSNVFFIKELGFPLMQTPKELEPLFPAIPVLWLISSALGQISSSRKHRNLLRGFQGQGLPPKSRTSLILQGSLISQNVIH